MESTETPCPTDNTEEPLTKHGSTIPPENTFSVSDRSDLFRENTWLDVIKNVWKLETESTDITNAARIMKMMCRGADFIYTEAQDRKLAPKVFRYPSFYAIPSYKKNVLLSYDPNTNRFLINLETLASYSQIPQNEDVTASDEAGKIKFKGLLTDYCFLGGVEEMTHAIESQRGEITQTQKYSDKSSQEEYDALDHEFRALKWQIYAASKVNMPLTTIKVLRERLKMQKNISR